MTKYRIVVRPGPFYPRKPRYFAQQKYLGLFWRDCPEDEVKLPEASFPYSSYDLKLVEQYVECLIEIDKAIKQEQRVVKIYP